MKKIWKKITATLCAAVTAGSLFAFTACQEEKEIVNAYDIAVKNGFKGDEQAWLASLRGADGKDGEDLTIEDLYEAAKEDGFEGSMLEFIQSLNVKVQEDNATDIIAQNLSSVVNICCAFTKKVTVGNGWLGKETKEAVSAAAGSGVVVHLEENRGVAYVVTNYHVVYDADMGVSDCIWLYPYGARQSFSTGDINGNGYIDNGEQQPGNTQDGDGIEAHFIGGAMDYDIALLSVNSADLVGSVLKAADFGDSNEVTVGEKVFAIGNSNGLGISATNGIVSVESENIQMSSTDGLRSVYYRVLRTDAAINHGNSGGGLFNAKGELIGITNAKSVADETDNMGYALPITQVKYLLQNMWNNKTANEAGYVLRAWLGVETYIESSEAAMVGGKLQITETFLVSSVLDDGAVGANSSGDTLKVGDVFQSVTIGGVETPLTRRYQLNDLLLTVKKGDTVTFKVLRDGNAAGKVETSVSVTFDKDSYFVKYE